MTKKWKQQEDPTPKKRVRKKTSDSGVPSSPVATSSSPIPMPVPSPVGTSSQVQLLQDDNENDDDDVVEVVPDFEEDEEHQVRLASKMYIKEMGPKEILQFLCICIPFFQFLLTFSECQDRGLIC